MSLESQVLKAFKTISEKEGIKVDNPTVILVDKDPTQSISIGFETGIIEFNPKCLKQPTFEKMIRKGGLDRFLEYSILIEVLKHKIKDRKKGSYGSREEIPRIPGYGWGCFWSFEEAVEVGSEEG